MNYFDKPKLLVWMIIALLVLNAGTLGFFWFGRPGPPPIPPPGGGGPHGGPGEMIVRELALNDAQRRAFDTLRREHHTAVMQIQQRMKNQRDHLFSMLPSDNPDSASILAAEIGRDQGEIDRVTFDHFRRVRLLCTPEQQHRFDEIIGDALRMLARQP